ncbi:hypothetical protein [Halopiger djelfimassiliensis]|uniref:hypothetical protein n=1 Tax=Halopiger djelfimassiliensis TaxID=1293047 RepID=UPI0006777A35|nr:hypothetical protein [Halopiger djelfimassiliensis]
MTSIQTKRINGAGPYAYRVTYDGGEHHWEYLGPAGDVDVGNIDVEEPAADPQPVDVGKLTVADMPPAPDEIPPIEDLSVDELVTLSRLMAKSDRDEWDDDHDLLERAIHERIREEVDVDDLEPAVRHHVDRMDRDRELSLRASRADISLAPDEALRGVATDPEIRPGDIESWDEDEDLLAEDLAREIDRDALKERIRDAEEAGVLDPDPQGERPEDADEPALVDDRDRQGQLDVGDAAARTSDRLGQSTQGASERFADDRDDRHAEEEPEYQDAKLTTETEEIDGQQSLNGGEASVDKEPEWQD